MGRGQGCVSGSHAQAQVSYCLISHTVMMTVSDADGMLTATCDFHLSHSCRKGKVFAKIDNILAWKV